MKNPIRTLLLLVALALGSILMLNDASAQSPRGRLAKKKPVAIQAQPNNTRLDVDVIAGFSAKIANKAILSAGPSHYLVVFGYEARKNPANQSHTFAAYVEANQDGTQKWTSISWLPADFSRTRHICVFTNTLGAIKDEITGGRCQPVTGGNYSVQQTLNMAKGTGKTLGVWGPYRITPEFYSRGIERAAQLTNQETMYLADDRKTRPGADAINCMHAVSDLLGYGPSMGGFMNKGLGIWGIAGTKHVLNFFQNLEPGYILDPISINEFVEIKNY